MKKLLFILVLHCIIAVGIETGAQDKWREVWITRADTNLVRYETIKPDPEFANDWIEYKTNGKVIYVDDGERIFECSNDSVYYALRFLPDSVGQKFIRHLFRSILMEKELDEAMRQGNARYYENLLENKEYIRKVPKKEGEGQGGKDTSEFDELWVPDSPPYREITVRDSTGKQQARRVFIETKLSLKDKMFMMLLEDLKNKYSGELSDITWDIENGKYKDVQQREVMKLNANSLIKKIKTIMQYLNYLTGWKQWGYDRQEYEVNEDIIWPGYNNMEP